MNITQKKPDFEKVLDQLMAELSKLRTGRANPAMIEDVRVDYYGTPTPVKQLANITVPEPRQLVVQTWDKNALAPAEKAIRDAGLGLNPTNEGDKLRITIPQLTEERRRELLKIVGKEAEEAKIRIRGIREDILKELKKQQESNQISEDEKFRLQDALQKMVDEFNAKIKEIAESKEKDMMTI
ncbi:MAG: ribosome recycling factor [Candidatus Doudnabacteria bacterium RIFCSPHIGHO2_02_FULL_48_21]|uniref:Ribosome-recycling factor n=1 Tax=Candidatus Doudnabacteria bacterium RIFCSPLOWO2_02_FULL_48_13 TaxID=1817845 RepID=A0A1F5QCR3_9BACT|nr:MAG: ribosome recycling factor [Candidatus Doudnabacteria bacterium RIFCSPHIGHO2_01_48_18]OGE79173.1 MAG: ribosome recycling factor [Candidatus Doudnabacteria bacterium RIFCSPHIGHO2_01_FULL_48_180]OGE91805.1 MAG: ribosome recycling factor [Candidatus Doudnabacteria bacterium RIFCSPHIGHO2_12_FULL_47_25]OGE93655.1 MAG: ribosome recycling factor [Candidatus Doudnabacteria bacterium RIFCSPHIGHO2_02_FULL_48_21]OGE97936.1 MAG: ribosome recycling factor [Candidatus Doudnabacteria bacterium RIFCSPLO